MKRTSLAKELRAQGVKDAQLEKLLPIAKKLQASQKPQLSAATREKIKNIPGKQPLWPVVTVWSAAGGFAAFVLLVVVAQFTTPGSPIYALKEGTDYIRALISPSKAEPETVKDVTEPVMESIEPTSTPITESAPIAEPAPTDVEAKDESRHNQHSRSSESDESSRDRWQAWGDRNRPEENSRNSWWGNSFNRSSERDNSSNRNDNSRWSSWF